MYTRRVLSGEFVCINHHLVNDLIEKVSLFFSELSLIILPKKDLWTPEIKNKLISESGSIQKISEIPQEIRDLYKTVWEIPQRCLLDLASRRAIYIDQSQSLNVYMSDPNYSKLTSMHFYAWKSGLKTGRYQHSFISFKAFILGMYYLRTRPAVDAIKFTVDVELLLKNAGQIDVPKSQEKVENGETNGDHKVDSNDAIATENGDQIVKKLKEEQPQAEPGSCPWRRKRKGAPDDEPCIPCGS